MKIGCQIGLGTVLFLALSSGTQAQRAFHRISRASEAPSRRQVSAIVLREASPVRQSQAATGTMAGGPATISPNNAFFFGGSSVTLQQLVNPVPGFGFDFTHLAAINRDLDVRALIDPLTQMRLAQAERLLRETPPISIGFPIFASPVVESPPVILVQQPQPVVIAQQPAPAERPAVKPSAESEAVPQPGAAAPPLPEVGEFILVLQDGRQILAVAFARQDNQVVYITREGLRRSFPFGQLDRDATVRVNEERGTSLRLSL